MNGTLRHGGPDDSGIFFDNQRGLALANCRLAILDLSPLGHQPMFSDDTQVALVFNGEIYNFQEIKKTLEKEGWIFGSNSDTEVIIKAYQKWGIDCLARFRGMFAFALFDKQQEALYLVRDRLGVKPLYYYWQNGLLMFASETRALLGHPFFKKEIRPQGLASYFQFGYIPYPFSIWQNVAKIAPGSYLKLNKQGELSHHQYWDAASYYQQNPAASKSKQEITSQDILPELENILTDSFKLRMVSDVPVGVFLSGGIDSSLVAALLQKEYSQPLRTFTIGFHDKAFNEAIFAKNIANYLGTSHSELYCNEKQAQEIVPQLPEIYDEPFGDSSAVPTFLISKLARQEVKVVLSGDGGDEFFAGYDKYWKLAPNKMLFSSDWLFGPALARFLFGFKFSSNYKMAKLREILLAGSSLEKYALLSTAFFKPELKKMLNLKDFAWPNLSAIVPNLKQGQLDIISWWMLLDAKIYLAEDILTKVDRASMHNALEAREPLLDHRILEFVAPLPRHLKCGPKSGKFLLKKILAKYLPVKYWDRPKQGFSIPMRRWLLNDLKPVVEEFLSEANVKKVGLLNSGFITQVKNDFYQNKNSNAFRLWYLLVFQMWAKRWL